MLSLLAVRSPTFLSPSAAGWLFENHYALWLAAVAIGALLIFTARSRNDPRMLRAGQVALGVTLAWLMVARWFDTPAERLYAVHSALAQSAKSADVDAMLSHFDKNFTASSLGIGTGDSSDRIKELISARLKSIGIKDTSFTQYIVVVNADGTAATHLIALTTSDMGALKSEWNLSWNDRPNEDWKLQDQPVSALDMLN